MALSAVSVAIMALSAVSVAIMACAVSVAIMALSTVSVAIMALSAVSVAELVEIAVRKVGISLKVEQKQCIEAVLQRKDIFVTLPTGFGKSVIFHLLPLCCRCFPRLYYVYPSGRCSPPSILNGGSYC